MRNIRSQQAWRKYFPKHQRRWSRPYREQDKQALYRNISRVIIGIIVVFILQSFLQIKYLAVSDLNVSGNKDLNLQDVQSVLDPLLNQRRFIFFKNNNFFLLDTKPLAQALKESYNLEAVVVKKRWPRYLDISIKEKISHYVWQRDGASYLLDATGRKIRSLTQNESQYLLLEDKRSTLPEPLFSQEQLDLINQIYLYWQDTLGDYAFLYKISVGGGSDWELYTSVGYYVKIDTKGSVITQLDNLARILKAGTVGGMDIDYIDLRFGDKVYFK